MQGTKVLSIEDKSLFDGYLRGDPPQASEYTFTNLFMWRRKYHPKWMISQECLFVIMDPIGDLPFALFPIGPGDKRAALKVLKQMMLENFEESRIFRVESRMLEKFVDTSQFTVEFDRDNSDYVYLSDDLIRLPGNKYHKKKNHLNRFKKKWDFEYRDLDIGLIDRVLQLQEDWCEIKDCGESPDLIYEDQAVYEALKNYEALGFKGGAILINDKVEAFSFGERLNTNTAVIHIEKANPEIPELYTLINQMFAMNAWSDLRYINREQDLGLEGLRKAKESYYPDHLVEKYSLVTKV
jgi:uncharacterized protein